MSVLSKLFSLDFSLKYNCYELGHTWTESCTEAAFDMGSACFQESLKLYLPIFLIPQLINRRFDLKSFKQTFSNVLRSSVFLSTNAYMGVFFFCLFRHVFGKFYYILSWPPQFIAALMAIQLERPNRRGPLALYTLNVASQTLINNLISKKYIPHIRNFHVLVFTASIAVQFHLMKKNGYSNDLFSSITRFLLGENEIQSKALIERYKYRYDLPRPPTNDNSSLNKLFIDRHRSCIHTDPCPIYVLSGFFRPFLISTIVQLASRTVFKPQRIFNEPKVLIDEIRQFSNYRLGLFVGLFSSVFKLSNCLLRRRSDGRREYHCFVSALISGPLIYLYPNNSLASYAFWKSLESVYNEAVKTRLVEHKNFYPSIMYSLATAHLFYTAIVEPEHMKPSYMKFISRVSGNQINLFNRPLFRGFFQQGDEQIIEKRFEELRTVLPEYTSNYYKENISNWVNI